MTISSDQLSFLSLCLEQLGGQIHFDTVAREYGKIHGKELSKKAAAERFKRLKEKIVTEYRILSRKGNVDGETPKRGVKREPSDQQSPSEAKKIKMKSEKEEE
jgi:hypothetical protein